VWKLAAAVARLGLIYVYVQLEVNEGVGRVTPTSSELDTCHFKSRVEKAKVLSIVDVDGNNYEEAMSCVFPQRSIPAFLKYISGEEVLPDLFDPNPNKECSHGINVHMYKDQCDVWRK
jgi:hypothetical protein